MTADNPLSAVHGRVCYHPCEDSCSLFEEQIRAENELAERMMAAGTGSFGESLSYFPEIASAKLDPKSI